MTYTKTFSGLLERAYYTCKQDYECEVEQSW